MDIKMSLQITEKYPNRINLIVTGSFVRVYNQSYYLLTQVLGHPLKPTIRYVKSAGNRLVISGGLPRYRVEKDIPLAEKTAWGYQVRGYFDLMGYDDWLNPQKAQARADLANSEAMVSLPTIGEPRFLFDSQGYLGLSKTITLEDKQLIFLANWHKGIYPVEVEQGFIESIKKLVTQQLNKPTAIEDALF